MKHIIKLTENDVRTIVKRILNEYNDNNQLTNTKEFPNDLINAMALFCYGEAYRIKKNGAPIKFPWLTSTGEKDEYGKEIKAMKTLSFDTSSWKHFDKLYEASKGLLTNRTNMFYSTYKKFSTPVELINGFFVGYRLQNQRTRKVGGIKGEAEHPILPSVLDINNDGNNTYGRNIYNVFWKVMKDGKSGDKSVVLRDASTQALKKMIADYGYFLRRAFDDSIRNSNIRAEMPDNLNPDEHIQDNSNSTEDDYFKTVHFAIERVFANSDRKSQIKTMHHLVNCMQLYYMAKGDPDNPTNKSVIMWCVENTVSSNGSPWTNPGFCQQKLRLQELVIPKAKEMFSNEKDDLFNTQNEQVFTSDGLWKIGVNPNPIKQNQTENNI